MPLVRTLCWMTLLAAAGVVLAKEDPALKDLLEDDAVAEAWIYEDLDAGYAQARKTGKPLLVCFSCVP